MLLHEKILAKGNLEAMNVLYLAEGPHKLRIMLVVYFPLHGERDFLGRMRKALANKAQARLGFLQPKIDD